MQIVENHVRQLTPLETEAKKLIEQLTEGVKTTIQHDSAAAAAGERAAIRSLAGKLDLRVRLTTVDDTHTTVKILPAKPAE